MNRKVVVIIMTFLIVALVGCNSIKVVREKTEWCDLWWGNEADITKPRVLFIGNSISRAYFPYASEILHDFANCDRYSSSRSITDPALLEETKIAMAKYDHAVIVFNNGLHGWHLSGSEYEDGLRKYVKFLKSRKAKNCKLIYALITPVSSGEAGVKLDPGKNGIVLERNQIAETIMKENNIDVIDLYGLMEPELEKYSIEKGDLHYNSDGYKRIANALFLLIVLQSCAEIKYLSSCL
ncbi:hypothetical protein [Maribellus sp. YY47]|uniref:SGNH/GDSL hydrolase family protein n=1 Tax=Maribellus sp. YY47 TaxID=2929486 RepID=UPI002001B011|nr:hypothetical protein [Maribellus sp. YY47]MCK3685395.1 hypothetical protein [Maribellus sp. YY47]